MRQSIIYKIRAIATCMDTRQDDFPISSLSQFGCLRQDTFRLAAANQTTCTWNDAKRAEVVATILDFQVRSRALFEIWDVQFLKCVRLHDIADALVGMLFFLHALDVIDNLGLLVV